MSAPQEPSEFLNAPMPLGIADMAGELGLLNPTFYVPDYINLASVQKCLEDRRSDFVTVNSVTFSAELELESRHNERFFVLERDHFTLFSPFYSPAKFSYKSRNAVMSHLWRTACFTGMTGTGFVEVDGQWQMEQLPMLCFVFGQDSDTLNSSYLVDDNTIHEYYESTANMDMAELATVTLGKTELCVSRFFVVNRGKEYWAVDTKDSSISYTFGPSTKTRTISRLADSSMTVQALIDEEQLQISIEARTSQNPEFKLYDMNGEEVVEGDRFVLQIPGRGEDEDEDPEERRERHTMFDEKDWISTCYTECLSGERGAIFVGSMDYASYFGVTVVDGVTYLTFEGSLVQIEDDGRCTGIVVLPEPPSKNNRIHLTYSDDGLTVLSRCGSKVPVTFEWTKSTCGYFYIDEDRSIGDPAKLRIIKV